jgi:hypothetical protein
MTQDNVIVLAQCRPEPEVWRCACGTVSFLLHRDGRIECCGCRGMQHTGAGSWIVPELRSAQISGLLGDAPEARTSARE